MYSAKLELSSASTDGSLRDDNRVAPYDVPGVDMPGDLDDPAWLILACSGEVPPVQSKRPALLMFGVYLSHSFHGILWRFTSKMLLW